MDEESVPLPETIDYHLGNPDYANGVWAIVAVDISKLSGKTKRVNVTLPERVLTLMDKYATEHGETRSGLIAQAAIEYIASQQEETG